MPSINCAAVDEGAMRVLLFTTPKKKMPLSMH